MLRSRRTEAASPDLAARIILRAQGMPQVQSYSLWQSLRQLFAELHLPKPGYVLTTALVLGMFLGFSTAPQMVSSTDSDADQCRELSRRRRGVVMNRTARISFVISIILNVLMLGVILGQSPRRFAPGAMRQQRFDQVLKNLPEAEQNRLRERLQKLRAAADPLFGQIRQAEDRGSGTARQRNFR